MELVVFYCIRKSSFIYYFNKYFYIYNILNYKHDKESNDLEKTDVIKAENGGRIRKKDLWW